MLPVGTRRILYNNPCHYYVKLEDEDFSWWRKENDDVPEDNRMQVRMTDEMVMKESYFDVLVPAKRYLYVWNYCQ